MRHFAGAFVCALFVLGLVREAAHAQSIAPTAAPKFETEPFSGAELLRGKRITEAECAALPGAVWVAVDQQGECIRYYHSTAGGVGQSGGAHTVAGLAQMRADVGCAVMAAGVISVKTRARDSGRKIDPGIKASYDPIDHVGAMQHQPGRRMIVMSDPDDQLVSFHSQREFAERVRAKSLPVLQVSADSGTENFHGLHNESQSMAIDCAKDMDDSALVAKYQNKATPGSGGVSAVRSR